MVKELSNLLPDFPGAANQTHCFLHVLNLVVKSILWQFDIPKTKNNEILDDALEELIRLAGNIEQEEAECHEVNSDDGDEEDNSIDGWINERANITDEEKEELNKAVKPICLVLTRVGLYLG
jgi:hypothetical protein